MANFLTAYNITKINEGGYVNNPNDNGGETYAGIARNFHPAWIGWDYLDGIYNKSYNAVYDTLNAYVADFYYHNYWSSFLLDYVQSQDIANLLYDWFINSGKAVKEVQKVLNGLGHSLTVDNKIGNKTIAAINATNPEQLDTALIEARKDYYIGLVDKGILHSSFLNGLLARAERYKNAVVESVGKHPPPTAQGS